MLITSFWTVDLLILSITIIFALYKYSSRKYDYFKKRNIYYVKPMPFLGNVFTVFTMKQTIGVWLRDLYETIDKPYFGIFVFDQPYIVLKSPELIKDVFVKNFNKFSDRTVLAPTHNDIVSNMLFFQKNPRWRQTRMRMSPTFTSGKLKGMFSTIMEVGGELTNYIENNLGTLETKGLITKFSGEVIARCAFAMSAHSFEKENTELTKVGKSLFEFSLRNGFSQGLYFFGPKTANRLHLEFMPKWAIDFLKETFWNAIKVREQSNVKRNDLIDTIIEMRKDKNLCNGIDFEGDVVVAQAVQFYTAGYETTSSTIAFALYELCVHPEIQEKLRSEIISTKATYNGITYDSLKHMKYLEMCIYEILRNVPERIMPDLVSLLEECITKGAGYLKTLRKYPVLPFLDRRCLEEHQVPGSDLIIEKGMPVYIPLLGLHYDEAFFPEPEKFDPERFADGNIYNTHGLQFMPFGEGPRICIGERFAMIGMKIALINILSEFILDRAPETPVPVKFEPKSFLLQSTVGLPVRFKKL